MSIDGFVEYGEASSCLFVWLFVDVCRCDCFSISDTQPASLDV